MDNQNSNRDKIISYLRKYSSEPSLFDGELKDEMSLLTDLRLRSTRLVDFVLDVEDEFNIEIDPNIMDDMQSLGGTIEVINNIIKDAGRE